jgi:hypothetical protein
MSTAVGAVGTEGAMLAARTAAICGIPIEHHLEPGVELVKELAPGWAGSRIVDEPLLLRHVITSADPGAMTLCGEIPGKSYYRDERGELAVLFSFEQPRRFRQLMRVIVPGREYELRYEDAADARLLQWTWQRTAMMEALAARRRGLLSHAMGFLLPDGRAVLCPGLSGAGKSTLGRLLAAVGARVLSDDRVAVTIEGGVVTAWGTPWFSQSRLALAADAPLAAVVRLSHGPANLLTQVPRPVLLGEVMRSMALPFWNAAMMPDALALVDSALATARTYDFSFAPTEEAARLLLASLAT